MNPAREIFLAGFIHRDIPAGRFARGWSGSGRRQWPRDPGRNGG
jgi:hypothetical protein